MLLHFLLSGHPSSHPPRWDFHILSLVVHELQLFRGNTGVLGELLRAALTEGCDLCGWLLSDRLQSPRRSPPDAMSFTGTCAHLVGIQLPLPSSCSVGNLTLIPLR